MKLSDSLLEQSLIWLSAMLLTGTGLIFLFRSLGWEKIQILDSGFWSTRFPVQDAALFTVDGTAVEIRGFVE